MAAPGPSNVVVLRIGSQSIANRLFRDISNGLGTGGMKQEDSGSGETFWCYSRGQQFKANLAASGMLTLKGDRQVVEAIVNLARRRTGSQGVGFEVLEGAQARARAASL